MLYTASILVRDSLHSVLYRARLFGRLEIEGPLGTIDRFRSRQTASLLAFLIVHHATRHAREVLIEQFWPDTPSSEKGRASLSVALSSLRAQLEPVGTIEPGQVLIADVASVRLKSGAITSDVEHFEALLDTAETLPADEQVATWIEAVRLYTGPFLPGYYEDWVVATQERLRDRYTQTVQRLADYFESDGDIAEAIRWRRHEHQAHPFDTKALTRLIQLLREEERDEEAAQLYYDAQRAHGDQPLPAEISRLVAPLLEQYPDPRKARTERSSRPAKREIPLGPPVPTPLPLPSEPTRFFGRERERAELRALLHEPEARLITITAPGGMGKTRLVVELARELQAEGNVVYFVGLTHARSGAEFLLALAEGLGVTLATNHPQAALSQIAQSVATQPSRIVLDNFEQLIDTDALAHVSLFLALAPTVTLLITSQHRLTLGGEHSYPLSPLPVPTEDELRSLGTHLTTIDQQHPSIALFVDRARDVSVNFRLSERNAAAVGALVRDLEGVPLAITLAASRTQIMTLADIHQGLKDRFALLRSERRGLAERHRSLQLSISWSYSLFSAPLKAFFQTLFPFRGSFTAAAAAAVSQAPLSLDLLAQLCDTSFITAVADDDTVRFQILGMLQDYGRQQNSGEEITEIERRHALYFAEQAQIAARSWRTEKAVDALNAIERDHENFSIALRWLASSGALEDRRQALLGASALVHYWLKRAYFDEGLAICQMILSNASSEQDTRPYRETLKGVVVFLLSQSRFEESVEPTYQLLELSKTAGDSLLTAVASANAGMLELARQNIDASFKLYFDSLRVLESLQDLHRVSTTKLNIAINFRKIGDLDQALTYAQSGIQDAILANNPGNIAWGNQTIGDIYLDKRQYSQAIESYISSLSIAYPILFWREMWESILNIGIARYQEGKIEEATYILNQALLFSSTHHLVIESTKKELLETFGFTPSFASETPREESRNALLRLTKLLLQDSTLSV